MSTAVASAKATAHPGAAVQDFFIAEPLPARGTGKNRGKSGSLRRMTVAARTCRAIRSSTRAQHVVGPLGPLGEEHPRFLEQSVVTAGSRIAVRSAVIDPQVLDLPDRTLVLDDAVPSQQR